MSVIRSSELEGYNVEGRIVKIFASPETKDVPMKGFTFGNSILPPKHRTGAHKHFNTEECVYIVSGRGKVVIEKEVFNISNDSVILIPPNYQHEIFNISDETMKIVWVFSPPGAEKQFILGEEKN